MGLARILKNNFVTYAAIGTIPRDLQERLAKKYNKKNTYFCWWSLGVCGVYGLVRLLFDEVVDDVSVVQYLGDGARIWGLFGLGVNSVRAGIVLATRRPLGDLALEIPYRVGKGIKKKVRRILSRIGEEELFDEIREAP